MNRATRMGIGLVGLIPVLGIAGWLVAAAGVEGEAGAWVTFGVAAAWIALMVWWALRGPAQLTEEFRTRYLAFLQNPEFRSLDDEERQHR